VIAASQTALTAAAARAAHLIVDQPPWIFSDTLAMALLGDQGPARSDSLRPAALSVIAHAAIRRPD
jgi:O-methyltransferase involved in polyketide biosynthesis